MKYFEDDLIAFLQKGKKIKKPTKKEDKKEEPTIYSKLIMYPGFISMGDMGNYPGVRAMEMKQQNTPQNDNTPKVTKYFLEKYASKPQAELKADNRSEAERQLAKTMTPGTYEYNVTTNPTRLWYSDPNGTGAMLTATGYTIPAAKQAAIDYFGRPVGEILKSEGTALNHTLNPLMVTDDVFQGAKQQMRVGNPLGAMALCAAGFGMGAVSSLPLKPVAGAVSQGVKTGAKAAVNTHYRLANAIDNAVEGAMNGAATAPQRVPATSIVNNGNGTLGLLSGGLGDYFMTMAENAGNRFWRGVKGFKEGFKKKAASTEGASETTLNPSTPAPETSKPAPKGIQVVDRKGNKRTLYREGSEEIMREEPIMGDITKINRGKDVYTIERGKDIYSSAEGTKHFYDGQHIYSEIVPGKHISTEINPKHVSTEINPVTTTEQVGTKLIPTGKFKKDGKLYTVENDEVLNPNVTYFKKSSFKSKPVKVVHTNTGYGDFNLTTGTYLSPKLNFNFIRKHPIRSTAIALGTPVVINALVNGFTGRGALNVLDNATAEKYKEFLVGSNTSTQQQSDSATVVNKGIEDANKLALLDAQAMNRKLQQADSSLKAFQQSIQ